MITSASLLYKRPAGTVGCLNLSKARKVTSREMPVITAWIKDMTENAEVNETQVMDFINKSSDGGTLGLNSDYYVQGVNRDPYIQSK